MSADAIRSLCERLGLQRVVGTFIFFRCDKCGHGQNHWLPIVDREHDVTCARCGEPASVRRVST